MKNLPLTVAIFFATIASLAAQKKDSISAHVDVMTAFNYMFTGNENNSVSGLTNAGGFLGAVSYGQQIGITTLLVTGYMKVHEPTDDASIQELFNKADWELTGFTSDVYFSSGLLVGVKISVQKYGDKKLPDFYVNAQAGVCNVRVPDQEYEFLVPDGDGGAFEYRRNLLNTSAVGSAVNVAFEADMLKSQNSIYNFKAGFMMENAKAMAEYIAAGGDPAVENGFLIFDWTSISIYLGVSVKFGL